MAPRKKAAQKTTPVKAKEVENGKVIKTPKPKKLSEAAKKDLKTSSSPAAKTPKKTTKNVIDVYISFEVCKSCHVFKRTATQIFDEITELLPEKNFQLAINEHGPPRRGSFEISISKKKGNTANATLIWSGIKKGPPRKEKFPDPKSLVELVSKVVP